MIISNYTLSYNMNEKNVLTNNDAAGFFTYVANGLYIKFKKRDK